MSVCVRLLLHADKSSGRQAEPQSLAVRWLLKQLTAPGPKPKSSTNDLAPPRRMGWMGNRLGLLPGALCSVRPERSRRHRGLEVRCVLGVDSDLEAFSHNPPDGSFAPWAYQPST